jgi:putative membrane protein
MGFGGAAMILVLIALIALTAYIVAGSFRTRDRSISCGETPLDIAKKRYARGEINKDEYDHLRSDLSKS